MAMPAVVALLFLAWFPVFVYPQRYVSRRCGPQWRERWPAFFDGVDGLDEDLAPEAVPETYYLSDVGDAGDAHGGLSSGGLAGGGGVADKAGGEVAAFNDAMKGARQPAAAGTDHADNREPEAELVTNKRRCRLQCARCLVHPISPRTAWFAIVRGWWQILSFAYLPLTAMALSYMACVPAGDGTRNLRTDASVECFGSSWYNGLFPVAVVFAAVYALGLPAAIAALLRRSFKTSNAIEFALKVFLG